jgi:hypothetical protein
MFLFNEAINKLRIVEQPLKGVTCKKDPLLETLEWVFTSASCTISYHSSFVYPLVKPTSDHVPCVIAIEQHIQV